MIYDWNDDADAWIAVGEALSLTCPGFQTRGLQGAAKREGESEDCHRHHGQLGQHDHQDHHGHHGHKGDLDHDN